MGYCRSRVALLVSQNRLANIRGSKLSKPKESEREYESAGAVKQVPLGCSAPPQRPWEGTCRLLLLILQMCCTISLCRACFFQNDPSRIENPPALAPLRPFGAPPLARGGSGSALSSQSLPWQGEVPSIARRRGVPPRRFSFGTNRTGARIRGRRRSETSTLGVLCAGGSCKTQTSRNPPCQFKLTGRVYYSRGCAFKKVYYVTLTV